MKRKPTGPALDLDFLIATAQQHLAGVKQWKDRDIASWQATAAQFAAKAEATIELLERHCHKSSGPVDDGQPYAKDLYDRLQWIIDTYQEDL